MNIHECVSCADDVNKHGDQIKPQGLGASEKKTKKLYNTTRG